MRDVQRRPTWASVDCDRCHHGTYTVMVCGQCNIEAGQEEIMREAIEVLRQVAELLHLLAHPKVIVSSKPSSG